MVNSYRLTQELKGEIPRIFISYRRSDNGDIVGRLSLRLRNHFGEDSVTVDVDDFPLGSDFRDSIIEGVTQADILLVLIGRRWGCELYKRASECAPTSEPDYVVTEIETAFCAGTCVIPLFIGGASPPQLDELPSSIRQLRFCNGLPIATEPTRFSVDVNRLIWRIERQLGISSVPRGGTIEYAIYLLDHAHWQITPSDDGDMTYRCVEDSQYRVVVDLTSEDAGTDYTSEWVDNFPGPYRVYPVRIFYGLELLDRVYFVSVWGAKFFVPVPPINGTHQSPIYYWDVFSLEMKLARHIAQFHSIHPDFETFAKVANIQIRDQ